MKPIEQGLKYNFIIKNKISFIESKYLILSVMEHLKESYQTPVVELMRIPAQSILAELSVPTEETIVTEGYVPDDAF